MAAEQMDEKPRPSAAFLAVSELANPVSLLDRYLSTLPEALRESGKATIARRHELERMTVALVTSSDPLEAVAYGEWVRANVVEIAYRWSCLMRSAVRWAGREAPAMIIVLPPEPR